MKKISLMTLALVAGFASVSEAKISQYATGKVSLNSVKSEAESKDNGSSTFTFGDDSMSATRSENSSLDADDMGAALSVGYGLDFGNGFRSDVELSYNTTTKDSKNVSGNIVTVAGGQTMSNVEVGDVPMELQTKSTTLMLNGYYDIKTGTEWTPYVMAGVGYAHVDNTIKDVMGTEAEKHRADNFAYQAGVGVSYALTSNIALDAGYRYIDLGKTEYKETTREEQDMMGTKIVENSSSSLETKNSMNQFSIGARVAF